MRVGIGYDVHRLIRGRRLFLGGLEFENSEFGLDGHSDADVLLHAVMDAMLGAAGLRDIGFYFPNTDEKYRNIRSTELLKRVNEMINKEGYKINNIDVIIVAEYPHMSPYIEKIRQIISEILNINITQVAIKATTEEGLGFIGAKEGIAVYSTVTLMEK